MNEEGQNTIEKAFELLHKGKECRSNGEHWQAADSFVQARTILIELASQQSRTTEEEQKIAELYEQQANAYLHQSRQCILDAMIKEKQQEEEEEEDAAESATTKLTIPACMALSNDEAEQRIRTFTLLFSRPVESTIKDTGKSNVSVIDQQWSIEERLMELNASLPKGFKTSEERMSEINRGLNRLGLSLYDQKQPFSRFVEELPPKSEEDQVSEIMAQVHDEVALEKNLAPPDAGATNGTASAVVKAEEIEEDSTNSDDSDEDESDALEDDDDLIAIKHIRKRAIRAQVKLAELVAILDDARDTKNKSEEEKDLRDEEDKDEEEAPDPTSLLSFGKKKLKSAKRDLGKALQEWTETLL